MLSIDSYAQNYEWAHFMGGADGGQARDIAVDQSGNVYTVGSFAVNPPFGVPINLADFNPGPGNFNFNRSGNYISKLNSNGQFVWARNLPVTIVNGQNVGGTIINKIHLDANGDIIITGFCSGNADLDAGAGIFTLPDGGIFLAKYSASGNFMWAKSFPGNGFNGVTHTLDAQNNIVLGIAFLGTIDADPGPDTLSFTANFGNTYSVLIIKLNGSGNLLWTKLLEGLSVGLSAVTTDLSGQIYVGGTFERAYFNGQSNPETFSAGLNDGYVLKLTTNGDEIWLKTFGGTRYDALTDLKTDAVGNIYFTGGFQDTAWFNNTSDSLSVIASDNHPFVNDGLTAKLDSIGNFEWAQSFGNGDTTFGNGGRRIEIDSIGNVYTLASIKGEAIFNRGFENSIVSAVGDYSLAIVKHKNDGDLVRVQKADGDQYILGQGIALDNQANVFFTGYFKTFDNSFTVIGTGAIDMDPSQDTVKMVGFANSQEHIFVAKWSQCSVGISTNIVDACTNYIWNNDTIFNTGTYTKSLTNAAGCDSIAVLNLNILSPVVATQNIQLCFGDSLVINNQTYTQSGIYQNVLTASNGCDSTVTTTLFIDTLQAQISNNGQSLSAINYPSNSTFQWLDCNNDFSPLIGETNQSFTPINNGSYAVIIDNSNCQDTSACYDFVTLDVPNISNDSPIIFYPNPVKDILSFSLQNNTSKTCNISLYNLNGEIIFTTNSNKRQINMSQFASGIYVISYRNNEGVFHHKLIKQ